MKRNSKRRHPFVVIYTNIDRQGDPYDVFIGLLQSPKVPERYAYLWALKKVRDELIKYNVPFEFWTRYNIYPINRFNCSQFSLNQLDEDRFYEHIHVADYPEEDDKSGIDWYNNIKSRYACKIK